MRSHTATGTFKDMEHAEDAKSYLLANDFTEEDILIIPAVENKVILKVHADSSIEMQEAVDVLRNYGAVNIAMSA
ncbi:MAG: hypothetical protein V4560_03650 [Bacteroidota bacterium]|jgi:hypothetical protein